MKVPFSANDQNNSKPTELNANRNPAPGTSPYEPKSVLELRGSPSPITDQKLTPNSNTDNNIVGSICGNNDTLQLEDQDHVLINQNLEDWDSLMRELGLHDDSTAPVSKPIINSQSEIARNINQDQYSTLSEFSTVSSFGSAQFVPADFGLLSDVSTYTTVSLDQSASDFNNCNVGFDFVDELIRLAQCFETNSLQFGHVILARLNQRLRSPIGKPLQRAAFYLKEAFQSLLTGSNPISRPASSSEIVQTIKAQKIFTSISPITMFSSFTSNQAILDSLEGSVRVHVIDFDIGLGGHWASFMKELAERAEALKGGGRPVLRISALVPDEYAVESRLIRDNLQQFARELNMRFDIEFILIRTFEYLSFKSIKFMDGEKVAVILSPAIFRHAVPGFLNDLRRVSPQVVVHVDLEGPMGFGSATYRQTVIDCLEFYSALFESLESANFDGGDCMQRIGTFVLFPKILEGVEAAGRRVTPLREAMAAAGLRQVGLSQFAEFQAECLLRKVEVKGFHVAKRQAEMVLCWHDRPLVATSAWRY